MKKRILSLVLASVLLTTMMAGCTKEEEKDSPSKETTNKKMDEKDVKEKDVKEKEPVTISIGLKASHVEISGINEYAKAWQEKTGNKVEVQAIDDDQFASLMQTKMSTSGMWDIFIGDTGTQSISYQHDKNLVPLTEEEWVSNLTDQGKKFATHTDGKIYAFPLGGANSFGIVYNKEVFEKNNLEVPQTIDEFNQVADTLKEAGITPIYISMADAWTVNQIMNGEWANILAHHPEALEKLNTNDIRWDSLETFTAMFERLADWREKGYFNSDMSTATYEMAQKAVASGSAAMMYMGDWADPEYAKVEAAGKGKIGMMAVPTEDGDNYLAVAGPGGIYVSNQSENVEVAKEFINFLASKENLEDMVTRRASTSVWKNVKASNLSVTLEDTQKYVEAGKTEIHYNQTYLITPSDDANSAFMSVLLGQKTPEEAAKIWSDSVVTVGRQLGFEGFND